MLQVSTVEIFHRSFLLPIAAHYRERGWRVDGVATGITGSAECRAGYDHVYEAGWSRNPFNLASNAPAMRRLQRLVAGNAYDIVHVHTPVAAFLTRLALKRLRSQGRVSVVYTAHGFHFFKGAGGASAAVYEKLERLAGPWTDALIVINQEDYESALRLRLVPERRLYHVPGIGLPLERYSREAISDEELTRARQDLGGEGAVPFLMVAEMIPRKRHLDAIEAMQHVAHPGAQLYLAGDGPMESQLRHKVAELGLQERVRFMGYRRDVAALIAASRAVVLTSMQEGLNRTVMESLALETPVIGTDIRGVRDLIGDDAGVVVKVGDVKGIARAIERLADDPTAGFEMGRRGRKKMAQYGLENVLRLHDEIYERLLHGGP